MKCLNEMELKYIKQTKSKGIYDETGYYFKGEFLNRYKTKAIEILRARVEKAGGGDFVKGKNIAKDEWNVIHKEYLKSCDATNKTNMTKKPYYENMKRRMLERKIFTLNQKIEGLGLRKQEMNKDYDDKIEMIIKIINDIKNVVEKRNER